MSLLLLGAFPCHTFQLEYWQHTWDGKIIVEDAQNLDEQLCSSI